MQIIDKREYKKLLSEARSHAKGNREICGLLIDTGMHISFVRVRNVARRRCGFNLSVQDVRRIDHAVKVLGQEIIGTFHSHPCSDDSPGESDITGTVDDSLMFIFDCIGKAGSLWKIKGGKAKKLKYVFIQDINKR
jgi:proteasome lid subunit RPN8/RPN11